MDANGKTQVVVRLASGLNPIVPIEKAAAGGGRPRAGLYVTDDLSGNTYFAPAAALAPYAGDFSSAARWEAVSGSSSRMSRRS